MPPSDFKILIARMNTQPKSIVKGHSKSLVIFKVDCFQIAPFRMIWQRVAPQAFFLENQVKLITLAILEMKQNWQKILVLSLTFYCIFPSLSTEIHIFFLKLRVGRGGDTMSSKGGQSPPPIYLLSPMIEASIKNHRPCTLVLSLWRRNASQVELVSM